MFHDTSSVRWLRTRREARAGQPSTNCVAHDVLTADYFERLATGNKYELLTVIGHPKPAMVSFQVLDWLSAMRHVGCSRFHDFPRICGLAYALL
jgi:hypothetical protein